MSGETPDDGDAEISASGGADATIISAPHVCHDDALSAASEQFSFRVGERQPAHSSGTVILRKFQGSLHSVSSMEWPEGPSVRGAAPRAAAAPDTPARYPRSRVEELFGAERGARMQAPGSPLPLRTVASTAAGPMPDALDDLTTASSLPQPASAGRRAAPSPTSARPTPANVSRSNESHQAASPTMTNFLAVHRPASLTSSQVVNALRRGQGLTTLSSSLPYESQILSAHANRSQQTSALPHFTSGSHSQLSVLPSVRSERSMPPVPDRLAHSHSRNRGGGPPGVHVLSADDVSEGYPSLAYSSMRGSVSGSQNLRLPTSEPQRSFATHGSVEESLASQHTREVHDPDAASTWGAAGVLFQNLQARALRHSRIDFRQDDLVEGLQLRSLLAVGSMATVYHATLHGQRIVCKVVEHGGSFLHRIKDRRRRAILEGDIARLLVHPNIVITYACCSGHVPVEKLTLAHLRAGKPAGGTRDVTLHFQEYCSQGSLRSALDSKLLRPAEDAQGREFKWFRTVAQVAAQVATGLAYAHSCGVLHCDLKGENVLLQRLPDDQRFPGDFEYRAKIGDFGVSNVLSLTKSTDSLHGAAPGTILFMPPEVLRPPHVFSTKTDVWSLGMLLWEMWTEATPFEGLTSAAVMERILAGDLPEWPKGSPPLLRQLAARCWNMDAEARPTAQYLASTLCEAAEILSRTERALEGADEVDAGQQRLALASMNDEELEDALMQDDPRMDLQEVQRHMDDLPGGAHEHAAAEKGAMADAPPQDDAIATMLWQLLQPPRIEGALHVEVRPGRTMVVTQLPYLHPEKFAV